MDSILKHPLFQVCIIGVCCYFLALITRRIFEAGFVCLKATGDPAKPYKTTMSRWWNEVILYTLPVIYGNVVCLLLYKTTFFPDGYQSWQAAMVLGTATGFMSGFLYKVAKRLILRDAGVEKEDDLPVANVPEPPK